MSNRCQMVVFSDKAYNAIIRESFAKDPVETGGILLGHILDNGVWIVMEVLPPGIKCIFERAYFEYDDAFVNYLAQSVANQYKIPLQLLGLWHRHPGSMDVFSSTDDGTNTTFASQNPCGVISGLVNIDPQFRLTMYHMENPRNVVHYYNRPNYERVDIEVGNDIIPEEYFRLKYFDGEGSDLHPLIDRPCPDHKEPEEVTVKTGQDSTSKGGQDELSSWRNDIEGIWNILKRNKAIGLIALILVITFIFSFKTAVHSCKSGIDTVITRLSDKDKKSPHLSKDVLELQVGKSVPLTVEGKQCERIIWKSSEESIASVNTNGIVIARKEGSAIITICIGNKSIGKCVVNVIPKEDEYKLSATELVLTVGQEESLTLIGVNDPSIIKWISADNSIATVTNGKITSKKVGSVKITASVDEKNYECQVTINNNVNN